MILLQLLLDVLFTGSIYSIVGIGFALTYFTVKFFNFAHGGIITFGAYAFYFMLRVFGADMLFSIFLTLFSAIAAGLISNQILYKKLRFKKTNSSVLILVSFMLLIFFENIISLVFGPDVKLLNQNVNSGNITLFESNISFEQLYIIFTSLVTFSATIAIMRYTKFGKRMRAVSDNRELAEVSGINTERIFQYSFIISSLLAGISGIEIAIDKSLRPTMGTNFIIKGFAASIVGGLTSLSGTVFASFLIAFLENIAVFFLPTAFKDAITFSLLFLFLIFKPNGIFGGSND